MQRRAVLLQSAKMSARLTAPAAAFGAPRGSTGVRAASPAPYRLHSGAPQLFPLHHSGTQSAAERVGARLHHRFLFATSRSLDQQPARQVVSSPTTPAGQDVRSASAARGGTQRLQGLRLPVLSRLVGPHLITVSWGPLQ
ncbi:hypothetical protein NDU88_001003 [Pleurodeles waltl]|uniref:Uncharacterized protein n=1 Tax=Pleurodeles waltl TaxID=8319 RepID=A0AAV7NDW7_PLEWA|nr:hypothetical protein NDU88_001002 [Pleurodeles waltl]KAJ1112742.1 hypothetical protein NDU88_001003 [Pleurodeles waltl]